MILGDINNHSLFTNNQLITEALLWVKDNYNKHFEKGTIEITDKIRVNCDEVSMVPQQMLEAHRRHIDIHVPQSGEENMGWSPINNLKNCISPYEEERDVEFFGDEPQCNLTVRPGQFVIFYPEDAHAPNIGVGNHRKLCVKIIID